MKIVTVPHPSLRKEAKEVSTYDKKIQQVVKQLGETLLTGSSRGVGLSSPQIDTQWRIYVTKKIYALPEDSSASENKAVQNDIAVFINPRITKTSKRHDLGKDDTGTPLEGCLSIPGIYGPVPRYEWVEIEFQRPENGILVADSLKLHDFSARLAQHEIDHLDGILFTDYTLEYNLPIYQENEREELEKITDTRFIESF